MSPQPPETALCFDCGTPAEVVEANLVGEQEPILWMTKVNCPRCGRIRSGEKVPVKQGEG